jgi:hypothetical protein
MEEKVMGTVFLYRINVALAALLIFINIQILVNVFLEADELPDSAPAVSISMVLGAFGYGLWAMNSMLTKITIDNEGLEYKTLLSRRFVAASDVEKVVFRRKNQKHMRITLYRKDNKPFIINATKFKDNEPLIEFCGQFERG